MVILKIVGRINLEIYLNLLEILVTPLEISKAFISFNSFIKIGIKFMPIFKTIDNLLVLILNILRGLNKVSIAFSNL